MNALAAAGDKIRLKLDSALESLELIETTAEEFALRAGFDEDQSSHVNAVRHENRWRAEKRIELGSG